MHIAGEDYAAVVEANIRSAARTPLPPMITINMLAELSTTLGVEPESWFPPLLAG